MRAALLLQWRSDYKVSLQGEIKYLIVIQEVHLKCYRLKLVGVGFDGFFQNCYGIALFSLDMMIINTMRVYVLLY